MNGDVPSPELEEDVEPVLITRQTEENYETENLMTYDQKFLDKVRVMVTGGHGGNGCVALNRENYESGIPDGGDGGLGGSVHFQSSGRIGSLHDLRRAHFKGNDGKIGRGKGRNGINGSDLSYTVPLGTEIFEVFNSQKFKSAKLQKLKRFSEDFKMSEVEITDLQEYKVKVGDLEEEGDKILLAQGGRGGLGNFKRRKVKEVMPGERGVEKEFELRLKMIADVGFIGYPNAGKSTLLAAMTRAFPKIAAYPFTTLRPYIGIAKFVNDDQIIFADLPGIIEGAHDNKGLGHQFLQHCERTHCLLFVIDGSTSEENRSPLKDFEVLYNELKLYKEGILLQKPIMIAVNKSDRSYTNFSQKFNILKRNTNYPIIPISAKEGQNLEVLLEALKEVVDSHRVKEI
jgi:GTP-binding protein